MTPAFQGPPMRNAMDDKIDDMLARIAANRRGDGLWFCRLGIECGHHRTCLVDGTAAPRVVKDLPNVTTEQGKPGALYCFCHSCEQLRRRGTKRPRWTA